MLTDLSVDPLYIWLGFFVFLLLVLAYSFKR
jgi:hypothetical protein